MSEIRDPDLHGLRSGLTCPPHPTPPIPIMSDPLRILDANANRAREAMRVMEDAARFLLDDAALSGELKAMRHDFAEAMRAWPGVELHRDTPGDVGTAIATEAEGRRESAAGVVLAAGKRLSEALRCCEEYGKLLPPSTSPGGRGTARFAASVERLRYRGYDVEARLHRQLAGPTARQWRVCVIVTEKLCRRHDWLTVARLAAEAGADCLQLREKNLADGELLERAERLVEMARGVGDNPPAIIINDRPDIALLAGTDGVHLGRGDLPVRAVRKLVGPRMLIGASTHDPAEARAAVEAGANYCGVGAMFATATKRRKPSGIGYLRQFLAEHPAVPHLAIGGIMPANAAEMTEAGARGVAVSAAVCGAEDPGAAVREIRKHFRG